MKKFLIISFGEITLKKNNRSFFEKILANHINIVLKNYHLHLIKEKRGRCIIFIDDTFEITELLQELRNIFGIKNIYEGYQIARDLDTALEGCVRLLGKTKTYKVRARRTDKSYPLCSIEINNKLGELINKRIDDIKVDVHKPEVLLNLEVYHSYFLVYKKVVTGVGGLPYSCSGKVVSLLSSGIDSPAASWMMMKRGCEVIFVHFHTPPYTGENSILKVKDLVHKLALYSFLPLRLYMVNITALQIAIKKFCKEKHITIITRRMMGKITQHIADLENAKGIVTGEAMAQVASQTLYNLYCVNDVYKLPVLRPLIGFDKEDIINLARKIGTYDISIREGDDCCALFSPKHPETKGKLDMVMEDEKIVMNELGNILPYNYEICDIQDEKQVQKQ